MRCNFSNTQQQARDLALDLGRGEYAAEIEAANISKADLEKRLRELIGDELLKGRTLYQSYRRNSIEVHEIVENIVDVVLLENVLNSPFMDRFVERKFNQFGERNEFYSEGGLLVASTFAGNHWDTNRQFLADGESHSIPTEWVYVHCYEDLDRFMKGIVPLEKMIDKIIKSINKFIQDRIYACFQNVAGSVPSDFSATGNDEDALGKLVDTVSAAGGYDSITIAGTKGALRKLAGVVPDKTFADSMKESKALNGSMGYWEGNTLMVIPQTLKSGTFQLALNEDKVFILGGDSRPIKLYIEGDTRSAIDSEGKKHNDQSIDMQVQTKVGVGMILPQFFGVFTFAD